MPHDMFIRRVERERENLLECNSSELNFIANAALICLDDKLASRLKGLAPPYKHIFRVFFFYTDRLLSRDFLEHIWGLDICMTTLIN